MKERKKREELLTRQEVLKRTGISARALNKFEKNKYIRAVKSPDGTKYYTNTTAEIVTAMAIRAAQCRNLDEAHLVAIQDMAFKNVQPGCTDSCRYLMMDPRAIKKHPRFAELLNVDEGLVQDIAAEMKILGFFMCRPLLLAVFEGQEEPVLADGNTRLDASIMAGQEWVPVVVMRFPDEDAVVRHIAYAQAKRRQNKDWVLYRLITEIDCRMKRGGDRRSECAKSKPPHGGIETRRSPSALRTASLVGCSHRKVERVRTVLKHGSDDIRDAVRDGKMTINKAYNSITKKQQNNKTAHKRLAKHIAREVAVLLEELDATAVEEIGGNLVHQVTAAVKKCIARQIHEKAPPEHRDSLGICAECRCEIRKAEAPKIYPRIVQMKTKAG